MLASELSSSGVEVLLTTAHYFSRSQRIILKGLEAVTQNSKYLQESFNSSLHSDELIRKSNKIYVKTKSLAQDTMAKLNQCTDYSSVNVQSAYKQLISIHILIVYITGLHYKTGSKNFPLRILLERLKLIILF